MSNQEVNSRIETVRNSIKDLDRLLWYGPKQSNEQALQAEPKRLKDPDFKKKCYGWHANFYYFQRGLYFKQVKRYLDTFGKDNVLVFLFEELAGDAIGVAQKTFRFLGVDDTFVPIVKVHNPAGSILNIPRFWEDTGLLLKTTSFVFSKNLLKKIPHLLRNIGQKPPASIRLSFSPRGVGPYKLRQLKIFVDKSIRNRNI